MLPKNYFAPCQFNNNFKTGVSFLLILYLVMQIVAYARICDESATTSAQQIKLTYTNQSVMVNSSEML